MIPERAQAILDFWFKETPSDIRFKKDEKFDQKIRDNFLKDYEILVKMNMMIGKIIL
tara:strand:- start:245 stop:415 length:171 start_codon:yes stop_codon:yes gene_type:complete